MLAFFHKLKNFLVVDTGGVRVFVGAGVRLALIGATVAFGKSLAHNADGQFTFDWGLFGAIICAIVFFNIVSNILDVLLRGGALLPPIHGHFFRAERKQHTAAALRRISLLLTEEPRSHEKMRELLPSILDCVVLHVRDARGSHDKDRVDVFGSLLLEDKDDLVVVARDSFLHSPQYRRQTPVRYGKATMLAARAIAARRALSVGDLCAEYPEAPKNKPYRSILAIPVIATDDTVLGALSIDSTRPYFFQSFQRSSVENSLENGLMPYVALLVLALEAIASGDRSRLVSQLVGGTDDP